MPSLITSVFNITPTPFHDDGSLDLESLRRLTAFTREKGVNGMTILGVLGEADKLTEAERDSVIATTIEAAGTDFPICVGTTHAGTDGCIAYSQRAQELGATAVMVAPPRMARVNDAALERHYRAVADAIDIPVVVQDFPPAVGGLLMSVEVIARIGAASPKLRCLKLEDEPSPMKVSQVRAANPDIIVLGGLGGMMFLEELRHGAHGTMTGFAYPEILVRDLQAFHGRRCGWRGRSVLPVPPADPLREPAADQSRDPEAHLSPSRRDRLAPRTRPVRASGCGDAGRSRRHSS